MILVLVIAIDLSLLSAIVVRFVVIISIVFVPGIFICYRTSSCVHKMTHHFFLIDFWRLFVRTSNALQVSCLLSLDNITKVFVL